MSTTAGAAAPGPISAASSAPGPTPAAPSPELIWLLAIDPPTNLGDTDLVRLSPLDTANAPFIAALHALDARAFAGPLGRVRPPWVFYDCLLASGVSLGHASRTAEGLTPTSLLGFIPTLTPGLALIQTLAVDSAADARDLLTRARSLGLADRFVVTLPWSSPLLATLVSLGEVALEAAYLPSLDDPRTVTVRVTPGTPPTASAPDIAPLRDPELVTHQASLERGAELRLTRGLASIVVAPVIPAPSAPASSAPASSASAAPAARAPRPTFADDPRWDPRARPRLTTHNDALFESLSPFIVATRDHLAHADPAPFGLPTRWHLDPQRMDHAPFFWLLQRLDQLTFGPEGMPMDRWVFYDCAERPGLIYGFALPAAALSASERDTLRVPPDYQGPVPLSMYIAIPAASARPDTWFGHNLASLNRALPERGLRHLGSITKAFALAAFRARHFLGATQWTSSALFIHTKFGPLELRSTWTPAHSIPETLTYAFDVTELSLRAAAGDPSARLTAPTPDLWLAADDRDGMRRLQAELEAGARYELCGPAAAPHLPEGALARHHPIRALPAR